MQTGTQALRDGNPTLAVREFQSAARLAPDTADVQAALSAAYLASGSRTYAWQAARAAYRLDRQSAQVAEQLTRVGAALLSEDGLAVGRPTSAVKKLLGAPDRINTSGTAERWVYGCLALDFADGDLFSFIDLRGFDPALQQTAVRLAFRPEESKWKLHVRRIDRGSSLTEYKSVDHPGDVLVVQRIYRWSESNTAPREWLNRRSDAMRKSGVDSEWKVLEDDDKSLLFANHVIDPVTKKGSWEITRLLKGKRDLFRVSFVTESGAKKLVEWKSRLKPIVLREES